MTQLSDDHDQLPAYKRGYACVDGEFMPAAEATVSIFDHSFLYGDGVFESIVCRKGRPFALQPHLDRLDASCRYLQLAQPYTAEQLTEMVHELIERNGLHSGIVTDRGQPRRGISGLGSATGAWPEGRHHDAVGARRQTGPRAGNPTRDRLDAADPADLHGAPSQVQQLPQPHRREARGGRRGRRRRDPARHRRQRRRAPGRQHLRRARHRAEHAAVGDDPGRVSRGPPCSG